MLELLFCALFTVVPDFLYRRLAQGKRLGREITLFSVWYELRFGITACLMLTIALITVVFYYHPSTTNVSNIYRTVTILPEGSGRVDEIMVQNGQQVQPGEILFTIDDSTQQTAVVAAESYVAEIQASFAVAEAELAAADGQVSEAEAALQQAKDELDVRQTLLDQGSAAVNTRDVEKLQNTVDTRLGSLDAAVANQKAVEENLRTLLPAREDTARAALEQAQAELDKTIVRAGVEGTVEQFALQKGDIVNPLLRPAGILVPPDFNENTFIAGFKQVNAQVLKSGQVAEITCATLPFTIVPMKVTYVQEYVPSGQFRPTDRLLDVQDFAKPGSVMLQLEPLFEGDVDRIPRGSKCIANIYTNNHDILHGDEDLSTGRWLFLHMVDTVGLVHALILRIQTLLLPVQTLVLSGH